MKALVEREREGPRARARERRERERGSTRESERDRHKDKVQRYVKSDKRAVSHFTLNRVNIEWFKGKGFFDVGDERG